MDQVFQGRLGAPRHSRVLDTARNPMTAGEPLRRRLAAILAADIAGYSRLMGQDEAATVRDLKGRPRMRIET